MALRDKKRVPPAPPKKSKGDDVHALVKALASSIPLASGPLSVMMETVFAPPIERRREEWFAQMSEVVMDLQKHALALTPDKLAKNELFISVALQATQIALRNHQREKLDALRNAIFN